KRYQQGRDFESGAAQVPQPRLLSIHSRAGPLAFCYPNGSRMTVEVSYTWLNLRLSAAQRVRWQKPRSSVHTRRVYSNDGFEVIDEVSRRTMTLASDEAAKAISTADPADAAVLEKVSHWFAQHGVAWSGTPAELAGILGCPAEQLVHAIEVASATLLVSGIAGSVCKRPGLPTVICLRRLEEICDECKFSPDPCDTNP